MPNTTNKDYTQYSEKQLFNLIHQLEQKSKRCKMIEFLLKKNG
ncbi:hypothetical protein HPNQ4053_0418 [Helicobacter pylori NQ4053]|uniref:Uncharacterized protein n=1 Tax=Helicobacter pylori NQ4053 TaxID=992027 RepID=J0JC08_HELPX|nr:hypothetical protein HPNQ4053_0418 [Helicobacter pylori NQ4053]